MQLLKKKLENLVLPVKSPSELHLHKNRLKTNKKYLHSVIQDRKNMEIQIETVSFSKKRKSLK